MKKIDKFGINIELPDCGFYILHNRISLSKKRYVYIDLYKNLWLYEPIQKEFIYKAPIFEFLIGEGSFENMMFIPVKFHKIPIEALDIINEEDPFGYKYIQRKTNPTIKNPSEPKFGLYWKKYSFGVADDVTYISPSKKLFSLIRKPVMKFIESGEIYSQFIQDLNREKFKLIAVDTSTPRGQHYLELVEYVDPVGFRRMQMRIVNPRRKMAKNSRRKNSDVLPMQISLSELQNGKYYIIAFKRKKIKVGFQDDFEIIKWNNLEQLELSDGYILINNGELISTKNIIDIRGPFVNRQHVIDWLT